MWSSYSAICTSSPWYILFWICWVTDWKIGAKWICWVVVSPQWPWWNSWHREHTQWELPCNFIQEKDTQVILLNAFANETQDLVWLECSPVQMLPGTDGPKCISGDFFLWTLVDVWDDWVRHSKMFLLYINDLQTSFVNAKYRLVKGVSLAFGMFAAMISKTRAGLTSVCYTHPILPVIKDRCWLCRCDLATSVVVWNLPYLHKIAHVYMHKVSCHELFFKIMSYIIYNNIVNLLWIVQSR